MIFKLNKKFHKIVTALDLPRLEVVLTSNRKLVQARKIWVDREG